MGINEILLVVAALLPAIVLCVYVFKKDRVEKEPIGLLAKLFMFGAISCYPAAILEGLAFEIIDSAFMYSGLYIYNFVRYFIGVALVEEGLKYIVLILVTKDNKEYNSFFDGLIYAVFVSLGFAALENIFYVTQYGWGNAVARALLSVPGHMFFSVMMGYYYSIWHVTERAIELETELKNNGKIPLFANAFKTGRSKLLAIVVPVLAHGLYNFSCTIGTSLFFLVFIGFVIFMYVHCFGRIKKMSKSDVPEQTMAKGMLAMKYPSLYNDIINL